MKYNLVATVTISIATEVEAESLEEAKKIAEDRPLMQIGRSPESSSEVWMTGELDGSPQNIMEE